MEMAETKVLISAFVPEQIFRTVRLKEAKEVVRCCYLNPCDIQTFSTACREAFIYMRH